MPTKTKDRRLSLVNLTRGNRPRHAACALLISRLLVGCALPIEETDAVASDLETSEPGQDAQPAEQAIVAGRSETTRNAIVQIEHAGTLCTGTLVKPDIVLTNGHCVNAHVAKPDWGRWSRFPARAGTATVRVGSSGAHPAWTGRATFVNPVSVAPDGRGHDDISLIALEKAVPASVATPMPLHRGDGPLVTPPGRDVLSVAGWSGFYQGRTDTRLQGWLGGALATCAGQENMRIAPWTRGAGYEPGDSGSPVFVANSGLVIGVMGNGSCGIGGFNATFASGSAIKPNVGRWLQRYSQASHCAQRGSMVSVRDGGRYRRLMNWWSHGRRDNFLTTEDGWFGCFNNWVDIVQGYGFNREEGWLLTRPEPGTRPIYLYWNGATLDNAAAPYGHPSLGAAWRPGPVLGWAYNAPGPQRVALRLWYSASNQDFFTTASTDPVGGDYVDRGVIGYALARAAAY